MTRLEAPYNFYIQQRTKSILLFYGTRDMKENDQQQIHKGGKTTIEKIQLGSRKFRIRVVTNASYAHIFNKGMASTVWKRKQKEEFIAARD